ncbi:surface protease GP63, partial [Trypanosoma theileri]
MKKLLETIISVMLFLLLFLHCVCGLAALRDDSCTYDTTVWKNMKNKTDYTPLPVSIIRELPQSGKSTVSLYTTTTTSTTTTTTTTSVKSDEEDWMPIRIHLSSDELDRVMRRCSSGMTVSSHRHSPSCRDGNVLTPQKRDILLNELLPAAIALHSERLLVVRSRFNLVIIQFISEMCYTYVELPAAYESVGVVEADFVLFVLAETVAPFVVICSEADDGRPTSAAMNFAPADIVNTRLFTRIIAHNLAHALGFDVRRISEMGMIAKSGITTTTTAEER